MLQTCRGDNVCGNKRGYRVVDFITSECLLFRELFAKPTVLKFNEQQGSSDG